MKKTIAFFTGFGLFLVMTSIAFAAPANFKDLVENWLIGGILSRVVPLLVALAVVFFIWGVFKFTIAEGSEDKTAAKAFMVYGIIGIFVMVSLWGLVRIFQSTFNLDNSEIRPREVNIRL